MVDIDDLPPVLKAREIVIRNRPPEIRCSQQTWECLRVAMERAFPLPPMREPATPPTLMGVPVRFEDRMGFGLIAIRAGRENKVFQLDREA